VHALETESSGSHEVISQWSVSGSSISERGQTWERDYEWVCERENEHHFTALVPLNSLFILTEANLNTHSNSVTHTHNIPFLCSQKDSLLAYQTWTAATKKKKKSTK